jgi:hypothetical protein
VNHALHFLLGVLTLSAWWAVWLLLVLTHRTERMGIAVDDDGVVQTTSLHTGRVTARFDGRPWLVQD